MSKKRVKSKQLSEQKTLPIQSPDAQAIDTHAPEQSEANVKRAKNWVDDHEC